jgi:hypothetical protein
MASASRTTTARSPAPDEGACERERGSEYPIGTGGSAEYAGPHAPTIDSRTGFLNSCSRHSSSFPGGTTSSGELRQFRIALRRIHPGGPRQAVHEPLNLRNALDRHRLRPPAVCGVQIGRERRTARAGEPDGNVLDVRIGAPNLLDEHDSGKRRGRAVGPREIPEVTVVTNQIGRDAHSGVLLA